MFINFTSIFVQENIENFEIKKQKKIYKKLIFSMAIQVIVKFIKIDKFH